MATRSAIVEKLKDGMFRAIYCHSYGGLSYNGSILNNYYKDAGKVSSLIDLGDIFSLGIEVSPPENKEHSYEYPLKNITIAYCRDRQEDWQDVSTTITDTLDEALARIDYSYAYLFINNEWHIIEYEHLSEDESINLDHIKRFEIENYEMIKLNDLSLKKR